MIIADGVPRYENRIPAFKEVISDLGAHILAVCLLDVSDDVSRARTSARAKPGDDFETRIKGYYEETEPAVRALAQEYPYYELDGTADPTESALKLLNIYFAAKSDNL